MPIRPINRPAVVPASPETGGDPTDIPEPTIPLPRDALPPPAAKSASVITPLAAPPDDPPRAYEVGYGKPPIETRFRPGQSGNPKGRSRNAKGLKTIVREMLTTKIAVRTGAGEKRMSRMEAVIHKTLELAMKGNPRALMQLISLYGASIPEVATNDNGHSAHQLTSTDEAILEALRHSLLQAPGEDL